jgi:hypothetical protein
VRPGREVARAWSSQPSPTARGAAAGQAGGAGAGAPGGGLAHLLRLRGGLRERPRSPRPRLLLRLLRPPLPRLLLLLRRRGGLRLRLRGGLRTPQRRPRLLLLLRRRLSLLASAATSSAPPGASPVFCIARSVATWGGARGEGAVRAGRRVPGALALGWAGRASGSGPCAAGQPPRAQSRRQGSAGG